MVISKLDITPKHAIGEFQCRPYTWDKAMTNLQTLYFIVKIFEE